MANPARFYALPAEARREGPLRRRGRGRGLRGQRRRDQRRAARGVRAAGGPPGVHGRHVDRGPRHVLRVLHARRAAAAGRRRPRLGGRAAADRGRRRLRAPQHVRRRDGRHLRRRGPQGALGAPGGGGGRGAPAAHLGHGRARGRRAPAAVRLWNKGGERWVEAPPSSTPPATRTCARWRASRTTRRATAAASRCRRCSGSRTWTSRRHGGPEGGAVAAMAEAAAAAPTACHASRARGTARRTRAWRWST